MCNTWPDGEKKPMTQSEHDEWNKTHYPGTRQICVECEEVTGTREDDHIYVNNYGPLCVFCSLHENGDL